MNSPDMKSIENFLYREAELLDHADLDSWIELYAEDGTYWMPAMTGQPDPLNHISHVYDDRVMMEIRRRNFAHPRAASKDPGVRCSHLIGNIRHRSEGADGELVVTSNFQVVMWYREEQRIYAGTYKHHLLVAGDSFLIRHKKVELINPEAAQSTIIIYL